MFALTFCVPNCVSWIQKAVYFKADSRAKAEEHARGLAAMIQLRTYAAAFALVEVDSNEITYLDMIRDATFSWSKP